MKRIIFAFAAFLSASLIFAQPADKVIKVGATPVPHADLLNQIKADLQKAGYTLQVVEFTDYVQPNVALENGEIDANFFQHKPYLDSFNKEKKSSLVNAGGIHIEPMGGYTKKGLKKIDDLKPGATIAVPNDPTNEGRALLLLQSAGVIKLKEGVGLSATVKDIAENKKKLVFKELEAAQLPRAVADVDLAIINGNFALDAGFKKKDAIIIEGRESPYVNIVAVKKEKSSEPKILALVTALQSKKIKDYIAKKYADGSVVAAF
ncbi:MAG: MetQ/NlpA family ABC transporter substrate-binding protein [Spirochaetaceae bacterium]|jgi:D-methionine transport system substrate-binding protein|nr:MetQ/NlpA family ABC transporter substrate-binding protein [Spirochaetaceae bacterium]